MPPMAGQLLRRVAFPNGSQRWMPEDSAEAKASDSQSWLIRIFVGRVNGKRVYRSFTFHGGVKDARKRRNELVTANDRNEIPAEEQRPEDAPTLGAFFDEWHRDVLPLRVREKTRGDYKRLFDAHVRPVLGSLQVPTVTTERVQALYTSLSLKREPKTLSPRTVRYIHAVLHSLLQNALRKRLIASNPADTDFVDLPANDQKEQKAWGHEDADKFLSFVEEAAPDVYALFAMALSTGMRPGEYLALQWKDIHGSYATVQRSVSQRGKWWAFGKPKTKKSARTLYLDERVTDALKIHRQRVAEMEENAGSLWQDYDLVFPRADGSPIRERALVARFKRLLERAKVPEIRLYDCRHSLATISLQAGVPLKVVSETLGHSSVKLTGDTYTHVVDGMQKEAALKVAGLVFKGKAKK